MKTNSTTFFFSAIINHRDDDEGRETRARVIICLAGRSIALYIMCASDGFLRFVPFAPSDLFLPLTSCFFPLFTFFRGEIRLVKTAYGVCVRFLFLRFFFSCVSGVSGRTTPPPNQSMWANRCGPLRLGVELAKLVPSFSAAPGGLYEPPLVSLK